MQTEYRDYVELFEYFGRGGMRRLSPAEFEQLDSEFAQLVQRLDQLTVDEVARLTALKEILLRDRPRQNQIKVSQAGRDDQR